MEMVTLWVFQHDKTTITQVLNFFERGFSVVNHLRCTSTVMVDGK